MHAEKILILSTKIGAFEIRSLFLQYVLLQ